MKMFPASVARIPGISHRRRRPSAGQGPAPGRAGTEPGPAAEQTPVEDGPSSTAPPRASGLLPADGGGEG